jgi:hypothetical protein
MGKDEVLQLAKDMQICDERGLFAKVVISYATMTKALNVAFGSTQGAGQDGFVGIYKDQLVCFESNLLGTKPAKERFRISFEFIETHEVKVGFLGLNNQFNITTPKDKIKLYFMKGRLDMIESINKAIHK